MRFNAFWIEPVKRVLTKIFRVCHLLTILANLAEKRQSPRKKFYTGKKFSISRFSFLIRLKLSELIPTKKFLINIFGFVIFWLVWPFCRKTTESHEKNFTRLKIFDFEIFILKYVLKHSESIPTKKNWRKFFDFDIFSLFLPFWPKNVQCPHKINHTGKIFRFRDLRFKIRFKTFWIDSEQQNRPKFFDLFIFSPFLAQKSRFWGFCAKKIFFKKSFCPSC